MGANHCHCNGNAFYLRDGEPVEVRIDSRIMVDVAWFRKMNLNYFKSTVIDIDYWYDISAFLSPFEYESSVETSSEASGTFSTDDASIVTSFDIKDSVAGQDEMVDECLLLYCPTVPGFSFKDKLWVEFVVADIEEINWSSTAFDCLALPDE
ncbi:hypothetical protein BJ875DRAFT_546439 [Amylocarpus encephaloides]|uniref:Uncharacterized protein n=1 Tax=Amylocarpus encephaloides TaxID=45428 RepID=A0A9P8C157_9HELO|nr:hypothetical protein BJ875DRAFT_546439 [Amylocarpus encephaloides]